MMPRKQDDEKPAATHYAVPDDDIDPFSRCYDRLFDFGLGPTVSWVYMTLKSFDFGEKKGVVWPSVPTIADKASTSEKTVQRALRELEEVGLITTERRPNKSSRYLLHDLADVPLPARLESPTSLPADRSNCPLQGRQIVRSRGVKLTDPGTVKLTAEVDKDKRSRTRRENQTHEPDQHPPASGGVGSRSGSQDPLRGHALEGNDHPAPLSVANDSPPPPTDFLSLRQRLERHNTDTT